jgi:hypothetical protein
MRVRARGCVGQCGPAQCSTEGVGLASGDRWLPGAAGLRRRLPRADAPARLPAARSAPPGQARTGHPPQRPRELANAQTVNECEHQGDEPDPTKPGEASQPVAVMVRGPPHPPWDCRAEPEPVKSAFGVLRILDS